MREGNWIDGRWAAPRAGDLFEPDLRPVQGGVRELWPRSSAVDLDGALDGLESGWPAWKRLGRRGRASALLERLDCWQRDAPGVDALALRLGLAFDDLDLELERGLEVGDRALAGGGDEPGPVLVRVPACELWEGLVGAVLGPLVCGAPVLLLGDSDLPQVAHELVRALVEPDPEHPLAAALALLHEDRSACIDEALASGDLARAWVPGLAQADADPATPVGGAAPRNASAVVLIGDDPVERAVEIAAAAFDPVAALSGQRAGHLGRVFCHERRLSAFTEALLKDLEGRASAPTCRPFLGDLGATCERLVRLGLDEGATLMLGGPDGSAGFRGALRKGSVVASVFTNVEPNMALARASRPAPVLSLVRLSSDAEARAAAELADRP